MENVSPSHDKVSFPVTGTNEITMQKYLFAGQLGENGKVFINKQHYFDKSPLQPENSTTNPTNF
jgi:hypothetical protein